MNESSPQHGMMYCVVCDTGARIVFPYSGTDSAITLDSRAKARCTGCGREKPINGWIYSHRDPNAPEEIDEDDDEDDLADVPPGSLNGMNYVSMKSLRKARRKYREQGLELRFIGIDSKEELDALARRNADALRHVAGGRRVTISLADLLRKNSEAYVFGEGGN